MLLVTYYKLSGETSVENLFLFDGIYEDFIKKAQNYFLYGVDYIYIFKDIF